MKQNFRFYDSVRSEIPHGAVLLFRPNKFSFRNLRWVWGKIIARLGRSEYCHAGMVERLAHGHPLKEPPTGQQILTIEQCYDERHICLEVLEGAGGRDRHLSDVLAEHYPGQIDVYHVYWNLRSRHIPFNHHAAVAAAVNRMRQLVNTQPYGWRDMFRIMLRRVIVFRLLLGTPTHDGNGKVEPSVCSAAVAKSMEAGGLDPVNNLPARWVEPGDLARSLALRYMCTLLPTAESKPLT